MGNGSYSFLNEFGHLRFCKSKVFKLLAVCTTRMRLEGRKKTFKRKLIQRSIVVLKNEFFRFCFFRDNYFIRIRNKSIILTFSIVHVIVLALTISKATGATEFFLLDLLVGHCVYVSAMLMLDRIFCCIRVQFNNVGVL